MTNERIVRKLEKRLARFCKPLGCTYSVELVGTGVADAKIIGTAKEWRIGLCFGSHFPSADLRYILKRIKFYEEGKLEGLPC